MLNKDQMDVCKKILRCSWNKYESSIHHYTRQDLLVTFYRIVNIMITIFDEESVEEIKRFMGTELIPIACPIEGGFIAYKAGLMKSKYEKCIIKLWIPEDAKRSSAHTNKCRCDKAEVLDVWNPETGKHLKSAMSYYDNSFVYKVGETIKVDDFDEDRFNECSGGIHFFMTEKEAINYVF